MASIPTANPSQERAIQWNDGSLLVLAGPGSGKTFVLTQRIARLLREQPDACILALTFTNKAATEMHERVATLVGGHPERAQLATFHGYAADVLRQHGSHVGLRPNFALVPHEADRLAVLKQLLRRLRLEDLEPKNVLMLIDKAFAEGGPEAVEIATPPWFGVVFDAYVAGLIADNTMDFGSLLFVAKRLIRTNRGVARMLRSLWTHVCIDEFQDTNQGQYEFLKLLVPPDGANLFVVADDDQIIYQWNGANPSRLTTLQAEYQTEIQQLPLNYRCPDAIIGLANRLIGHNAARIAGKEPLRASKPQAIGHGIFIGTYDNERAEAQAVAQAIRNRGLRPEDCAVLGRSGKLLGIVAAAISDQGITVWRPQSKTDFEAPPARFLYALMRLANARHEVEFLRRACVACQDTLDVVAHVDDIAALASLQGGDYLRALSDHLRRTAAPGPETTWLEHVIDPLVERMAFRAGVERFTERGALGWENDPLTQDEQAIWRDLHDDIVRDEGPGTLSLNAYLQKLDLRAKVSPRPPGAVRITTIHGAKGLEFNHVFLVGLAEQEFPTYHAVRRGDASREVEEERRNCFVAITRVQETLTITRARTYNGYPKAPSRFLAEMGLDPELSPTAGPERHSSS